MNLDFRARRTPPARLPGMIGTVVVHAAAAAFLFSQVKASAPSPPVYAVDLVAAPAPTTKKRVAREAMPTTPPPEKPAPVKPKPTPPPTTSLGRSGSAVQAFRSVERAICTFFPCAPVANAT